MPSKTTILKAGDECPFCQKGKLTQSPSGKQLMCEQCGRLVLRGKEAQASNRPSTSRGQGSD